MRKVRCAVASVPDVPPDIGKIVSFGEGKGECALFYHRGKWTATGSLCPHQNSPLEGALAVNGEVICLSHCYRFDLKTGDCRTVGGYGLPIYEVAIENDTVFVSYWEYD